MGAATTQADARRPLIVWLGCVCGLVVSMVVIGGITRLTGSGLSMVEWAPIMGAIPPLNDHAWQIAFAKYQATPQGRLVNAQMTLSGFKGIFFWEYLHRLVGRLIGVVFFFPWLFFVVRRRMSRSLAIKTAIGFLLGGLQGALGWFMVWSGLVDVPEVSHYRLAAHLVLALLVLAYLLWLLLDLAWPRSNPRAAGVAGAGRAYAALTALVLLQIVYGAFTAGLKAGYGFNTFPTMNGEWIPSGLGNLSPGWENPFDNRIAVQFIHRCLGMLLLGCTTGLWIWARRLPLDGRQRGATNLFSALVWVQFALGVTTLLLVVPVPVAVLHQLGACLVFASAVVVNHAFSPARPADAVTQ